MGMYDTINGEQVKCFPWVSFDNFMNSISYHGGDLNSYNTGDEVPCKRPHYNYGKNFIILDLNRFPESDYCEYDYILHIIVDGKVKDTFVDSIGKINWMQNENVIDYNGELLNIKSSDDILAYIKAQRDYKKECDNLYSHWDELFKESNSYLWGIARLEEGSEEKQMRHKKLDELRKLMDEEKARIKPELEVLREKHKKWFVDTSDIKDLIRLGNCLSAYYTELRINRPDNVKICSDLISEILNSDGTIYDRYIKWQGIQSDDNELTEVLNG